MLAIDRFFEKYPQYMGKMTFIQAGAISRIHIEAYKNLNQNIEALVSNQLKYRSSRWKPIILNA
jgi:trehalose 6-phosphate synthase